MRGRALVLAGTAVAVIGLSAAAAVAQYPYQQPQPPSVTIGHGRVTVTVPQTPNYQSQYPAPYFPPATGTYQLAPQPQPAGQQAGYRKIYRLVELSGRDHLYTPNAEEANGLVRQGLYRYEAAPFYLLDRQYPGTAPLYRFGTPSGIHFLSTDPSAGAAQGAAMNLVLGYIDLQPRQGIVPLYAWFNPTNGGYLYTTAPSGEMAPQLGMQNLGVVGYVAPA